jgi:serine phosphatase RsbU (regulator of sigma subunit)
LLFKQGKLRQLTNLKLKEQNKIISEKKLEIEQSIEYAKGIQTAFLPGRDELSLILKENFIFYKPKDVVSGDFYWYLVSEDQKGILLACADCTGHGVPGALMSMVGINILQQLSVERKMRSPGLILKYLNAEIKNSLKQNSDQSKQRDGMDIAIIYLDLAGQKLIFSGANRPLYLVREQQLMEYKATKHAIGGFTKYDQSFEEIKIDLQRNDLICLSTDGFADQFGKDGKKFMTKRLKDLLAQISHLSAAEQLAELESVFNNWKGRQEQVDDVCLIGIKV